MDFTFTEEQETIAKLARDVFEHRATPERLTELEAGDVRYDAALWKELAAADLLGTALPESVGGNAGGFVELGVLLAEVGGSVAPVPAYATLVLGADPIARHGNPEQQQRFLPGVVAGKRILTAALAEPGRSEPSRPATTAGRDGPNWRLDGAKELVPAAQLADTVLIPATLDDGDVGLFLLATDAAGVEIRPVKTTNREPHADVFLARSNSASPNGRCGSPRPTPPSVSNSAVRSAVSRRCNSAWPTHSSTSRRSDGPPGVRPG
jgi:alkylation response protein AidB-like acyl-CoA dehydrogenase